MGRRVECEIIEDEDDNEEGVTVPCVHAVCSRCQHETFAWGRSDASVRRALVMLREECPNGEENFYVDENG